MYLDDQTVIRTILNNKQKFVLYSGAGASADAGVKTARQICEEIKKSLISPTSPRKKIEKDLNWNNQELRYYTCIQEVSKNEATRVSYFKKLLEGINPSFYHYGSSLLISNGIFKNSTITTNFDKLIEIAFSHIGQFECQAIRMAEEIRFINRDDKKRSYLLKLHGDYDTDNVLNTREETKTINKNFLNQVESLTQDSGLIVIGTAGYEKSIHTMFDKLTESENLEKGVLKYGLLWGVYMGEDRPKNLTEQVSRKLLKRRIKSETICDEIVSMIKEKNKVNALFSFFPIWGAGEFIFDLVKATNNNSIIGNAELYLDHEMRLKNTLSKANLPLESIEEHVSNLKKRKENFAKNKLPVSLPNLAYKASHKNKNFEIRIYYGNITKRAFLNFPENSSSKKVVVSPEDTFLTAGGGVAYSLLEKGGKTKILNELNKFSPVKKNEVVITSGFNLPVHFIFHVAAIEIDKSVKYLITKNSLIQATKNILDKFNALEAEVLFIPLIGSGLAGLKTSDSFKSIISNILLSPKKDYRRIFNIIIFEDKNLGRESVLRILKKLKHSEYKIINY